MEQYNIHAAKTHLSSLVDKAAQGKPFIIAKAGKPLVTVNPYTPPAKSPRVGFMKEVVLIPDDFDQMCADEILGLFENGQ